MLWGSVFVFFCGLSSIWGESYRASIYGTRGVIEIFFCGLVLSVYIKSYSTIVDILRYMVLSAVMLFIKVLITVPYIDIVYRSFPKELNANTIGVRFAISSLILLWLSLHKYVSLQFFILGYLTFALGTLFSGSRKALFILLSGFMLILIFKSKNTVRFIFYSIMAILFIVVLYYIIMNNTLLYQLMGSRIEGLINTFMYGKSRGDASTRERIYLISIALEHWKSRAVFGYGIHSFGEIIKYSSYGATNMYTHCNYVELLFGIGVVGVFIYYSLHTWIVITSIKVLRKNIYVQLVMSIITIVLIIDVGMVSYGDEFIQFIMMMLSSILFLTQKNRELY